MFAFFIPRTAESWFTALLFRAFDDSLLDSLDIDAVVFVSDGETYQLVECIARCFRLCTFSQLYLPPGKLDYDSENRNIRDSLVFKWYHFLHDDLQGIFKLRKTLFYSSKYFN